MDLSLEKYLSNYQRKTTLCKEKKNSFHSDGDILADFGDPF